MIKQTKDEATGSKALTRTEDRPLLFDTVTLSEGFFTPHRRVNCAASFNAGKRVVYGTNDGVYISDTEQVDKDPIKVLALHNVVQIDVLEESGYGLLIVLSKQQVITFPLEAPDIKRAERISSRVSFFKAGKCLGKPVVCIVKSGPLSSTVKVLEPVNPDIHGHSRPAFQKEQGGNDTLTPREGKIITVHDSCSEIH